MGVTNSNKQISTDHIDCEGTLKVTLAIAASPDISSNPNDIVLVLDRSGSMDDDGKMGDAKDAAEDFADALLKEGNGVRMGVVSYANDVSRNQELTSNAVDVKAAINRIRADGGTNIQAGIHEARQMLENSTADKKVIVVLSDGEPTCSYPVKGMSGVYVFQVEDVQTADKQTAEAEKVRAQATAESMAQQFAMQAVQQIAIVPALHTLKIPAVFLAQPSHFFLRKSDIRSEGARIGNLCAVVADEIYRAVASAHRFYGNLVCVVFTRNAE